MLSGETAKRFPGDETSRQHFDQSLVQNCGVDFYGAPVGLILAIDRTMERGQWADVGIYLAHLLLLAEERGLATCAQAAWAGMNQTVRAFLDMPEEYILYCGVSMGYADQDAPINRLRIGREPLAVTTEMRGFGAEFAS